MDTLTISLPDSLKQFVNGQVSTGAYSSVSEYLRRLISEDQERRGREEFEQKILEAVERGEFSPMTQDDWGVIERKLRSAR